MPAPDHKAEYAGNQRYEMLRRDRDHWRQRAEDKMEDLSRNSFWFGVLAGAAVFAFIGAAVLMVP